MDFAYSPHREGGGLAHLPSPTHPHGYRMELSSIQQLRRSLSRSPSKPSRFQLRNSDSPRSPISPLALTRAFSPKPQHNNSPSAIVSDTPLATPATTTIAKKRFTLRRSAPFRSSPRNRPASKSPRRVLGDSSDHGNATPFTSARASGEENPATRKNLSEVFGSQSEQKPMPPLDIDDQPIKFKFAQSRPDTNAPGANCLVPPKSSPLKRSDGVMNLDCTRTGSPVAKRRSLHGASSFGADLNIFDIGATSRSSGEEPQRPQETESANNFCFSSPVSKTASPLRRSASLRKSTLQRPSMATSRSKPDGEFAVPGLAASKTRQRMSLDGSSAFGSPSAPSPFRRSINLESMRGSSYQPFLRGSAGSSQPHPLSHALTPSSSSPNVGNESPAAATDVPPTPGPVRPHLFSKSLPVGASRPQAIEQSDSPFATPMAAWKMAKPDPRLFMSTGLVSKKNRNAEDTTEGGLGGYVMPGTPSKDYKRNSFPPVTASPTANRFSKMPPRPEFGQPSTPFSVHKASNSISFGSTGTGANIFGNWSNSNNSNHQRRSSFASIDGDDTSTSPCGNRMMDSQSSVDDMPPTPTKNGDSADRRKKDSLRRTAVRQRTSLATDTFIDPAISDTTNASHLDRAVTPLSGSSPHTPEASFLALDPSKLSISGHRRGSLSFNNSLSSSLSFPPATPTTPRDHVNFFSVGQASTVPFAGVTQNDVDVSMSERFDSMTFLGNGEFSKVYRAESRGPPVSPASSRVWAVKKTKKPYAGPADREKKMQEVRILRALRGHDHILALEDSWEHHDHLYIQTEFCEEGDLKDFLYHAGFKGRIDDFRIWKILMELSSGVKHIHNNGFVHLDLKPANILIAFDGSLKIADFGMATTWPVARGIDGEGDRTYLAPEAFQGRFDKPNDVYQVGLIMFEIAGNVDLPENGPSWQRLRNGDFREVPSLTWSSESSLNRDINGEPIDDSEDVRGPTEDIDLFDSEEDLLKHITIPTVPRHTGGLVMPPDFMIQESDASSIHQMTLWMMNQDPDQRPTIDQVYSCYGCQWVAGRARAGATIFEGVWGPADDVLNHDIQMADMMDTS